MRARHDGEPERRTSQLAHSAGLTDAEAQDMSLRQIAAYAFNRGAPSQDWQRTDLP